MNSLSGWSLARLSVATSLLSLAPPLAMPSAAQVGAIVQPTPQTGAVERLNQNLNRLSRQPTDMDALIGAGEASYQLGDAQAANGFFMRADMVNARDGRVKLGLALVSVALKQPREAAAYFDEAEALGARADAHLFERAMTYDLSGQQDKAQRDYLLAMRVKPGNSEVIRAYAVSLGISGKVDLAEAQLRPLLFRSDRGAWRDRTMILAMNGRTAEARRIAQTIMPRSLADAMEPYLIRMGSLTAAQKAAATFYGQFPSEGLRLATVTAPPAAARPELASTSRRRSRDRGRTVSAPTPANPPEDSSLIAAMPRGDMPPPMVQALPPYTARPTPTSAPIRPVSTPSTTSDDPDGWTISDVRRTERRSTPPSMRAPMPAAPVPTAPATAAPFATAPVRTTIAPSSQAPAPVSATSVSGSAAAPVRPNASVPANAVPVVPAPPTTPLRPAPTPTTAVPASASPAPLAAIPGPIAATPLATPASTSATQVSAPGAPLGQSTPTTTTAAPATSVPTPDASPMSAAVQGLRPIRLRRRG